MVERGSSVHQAAIACGISYATAKTWARSQASAKNADAATHEDSWACQTVASSSDEFARQDCPKIVANAVHESRPSDGWDHLLKSIDFGGRSGRRLVLDRFSTLLSARVRHR